VLLDRPERLLDRLLEDDLPLLFFPERDRDLFFDRFFDSFFLFFFRLLDLGCQEIKTKTSNVIDANFLSAPVVLELLLQSSLIEAILT